jgi:hypothetical protein
MALVWSKSVWRENLKHYLCLVCSSRNTTYTVLYILDISILHWISYPIYQITIRFTKGFTFHIFFQICNFVKEILSLMCAAVLKLLWRFREVSVSTYTGRVHFFSDPRYFNALDQWCRHSPCRVIACVSTPCVRHLVLMCVTYVKYGSVRATGKGFRHEFQYIMDYKKYYLKMCIY